MLADFFKLAITNIRHRKLRSWLTILGVIIGIAAIVSLISISDGLQNAVTAQFEKLGTNKLIIMPGGEGGANMMGAFSANELTQDDLDTVKGTTGVDLAGPMFFRSGTIKFSGQTKSTSIIGLPTDETAKIITDSGGFDAEKGRNLKQGDNYAVTVGWLLWNDNFFDKNVRLRDRIEIEHQDFNVVGLTKKIGNRQDDAQIYMPIETARDIFNESEEITYIYVQAKEGYEPKNVAENIKKELRKSRDEKKGEETFQVQTMEQLLASIGNILGIIQFILVGIAGISLLVGAVGIMNTMYTSVLERTKEIGIMKSIGATNANIAIIFLIESGLIGLVGGAMGALIGAGIALSVSAIANNASVLPIALIIKIDPLLITFAIGFAFVLGMVSGVMPAKQAAKLKPADALRYE